MADVNTLIERYFNKPSNVKLMDDLDLTNTNPQEVSKSDFMGMADQQYADLFVSGFLNEMRSIAKGIQGDMAGRMNGLKKQVAELRDEVAAMTRDD